MRISKAPSQPLASSTRKMPEYLLFSVLAAQFSKPLSSFYYKTSLIYLPQEKIASLDRAHLGFYN